VIAEGFGPRVVVCAEENSVSREARRADDVVEAAADFGEDVAR
jgi:hypothetical protein